MRFRAGVFERSQWKALRRAWAATLCSLLACADPSGAPPSSERYERLDALSALWSFDKYHYLEDGRVTGLDAARSTGSGSQGDAMLRSVWSDDAVSFERIWSWTQRHLQVRGDALFAGRWKNGAVDRRSAPGADSDIALALLLASRRFGARGYEVEALAIVRDLWKAEIVAAGESFYPTVSDADRRERFCAIRIGDLAPHAYEEFAKIDREHPWKRVAESSYSILRWLYFERKVTFPPEQVYLDRESGKLSLRHPSSSAVAEFGSDAIPIFWRVALDATWHWRFEARLRDQMLEPFRAAWKGDGRINDRYWIDGESSSRAESLPLYAALHSLAELQDPEFARDLRERKLSDPWSRAVLGKETSSALRSWLWFDEALSLGEARRFDELLGFLMPFDFRSFRSNLPVVPLIACLALFPLAHLARRTRAQRYVQGAFLVAALAVALHYLCWRATSSLNFVEPLGPFISIALWIAELYCFASVVLLVVQVGLVERRRIQRPSSGAFAPSVDILIPVFREPIEILERTLLAARAQRYPRCEVYVLDDGHRDEVRHLTAQHSAHYLPGPRQHAKAGNLNHALGRTRGELVAVFDTDHVPTLSFLEQTIPWFRDPRLGFVQTPHHFRNADIFQHAFRLAGRIPNEQDLFNRGIQPARDAWDGAFFVGSGAVFRRVALEEVGGFRLLSITEDIDTSQHLHAAGWRSLYVDRIVAVGLSAENLASYVVQRRRWMLGCLQIFFRDNPLLCRGLPARHRVGYFASLYHFFFPLARIVFWITPLYYLLFHLHPILSEVAVLTARLLPYLLILPLVNSVLVPRWPRPFWGSLYENAVTAPLFRSMFDLLLPRSLGFQVTPKGILTHARRFDWRSARWTLVFAGVTALALAKGALEVATFGIEQDAYFFNMIWAGYNLLFVLGALMVAWERPQRRCEERVCCELAARIAPADGAPIAARTLDVSLAGCTLELDGCPPLPDAFDLELALGGGLRVRAALVYHERRRRRERVGLRFVEASEEFRRALLLGVFASSDVWEAAAVRVAHTRLGLAKAFLLGLAGYFRSLRPSRRKHPRRRFLARRKLLGRDLQRDVWLRDTSVRGLGLVCFGERPRIDGLWRIASPPGPVRWGRAVYVRRRFAFAWYVGIEAVDKPAGTHELEWEIAA